MRRVCILYRFACRGTYCTITLKRKRLSYSEIASLPAWLFGTCLGLPIELGFRDNRRFRAFDWRDWISKVPAPIRLTAAIRSFVSPAPGICH